MRVVQLTDIHMPADGADETVMEMLAGIDLLDPADTLAAVLDDVASLATAPDLVVCTGDLGDRGHPASYRRLNAMLDALGLPVLVLPGNHDLPDAFDEHLPGGRVALAPPVLGAGAWTFAFARSGNTEWGELGRAQVIALGDRLEEAGAGNVFVWLHHPPVPIHAGALPDADFLAEDLLALHQRFAVAGLAAGHVHQSVDAHLGPIAVHATQSTFFGGGGPGYRIVDFADDGTYRTETRGFPAMTSMTEAKRDRLLEVSRRRAAMKAGHTPVRGDETAALAEVHEWLVEADQRRGRPPRH